jgi:hypothetical protein
MDSVSLHEQLAGLAPALLGMAGRVGGRTDAGTAASLGEIEAHVARGCSRCARALVNGREEAVTVAEATNTSAPRAGLRERVLGSARAGALAARQGRRPRRLFDPAGELARLHAGAPGEAERVREIDALGVGASGSAAAARLLAGLHREVGFPLLFVSVVRGERVGFWAQHGFDALFASDASGASGSRDRRRETTFCTHTVSMEAPLILPDAAAEPFFRGSNMVVREGIRAYVGVPLQTWRGTSRAMIVGTVCAMDFVPRRIGPAVVAAMEACAAAVAAEIELSRA